MKNLLKYLLIRFTPLLLTVVSLIFIQVAYGEDAAYLKLKIKGATPDNRFFLCTSSLGCFSIFRAEKGKIYPILSSFQIPDLAVYDVKEFHFWPQNIPSNCKSEVALNKTLTISGRLAINSNQQLNINELSCHLSK